MAQELLTLQNLAKYYTSAQSVVVGLNQLNLTFCRGEFVAVTGESGSGKSTLAHVLGGILPYEGGELLYKGKPTSHYDSGDWERYRRDCVSFISQSYGILPGSSVMDNVTCALRLVGFSKEQAAKDAEEILKKVELWDLRRRRAAKLSSGQKQRLSIARALAKPAPVLIADEPTGNLDAENSAKVIELLAEAAKDRLVILITHEFSEAQDYVTRRIELHDGRVTMDAQLREIPALPLAPKGPKAAQRSKQRLSWFVSRFQIKARPVWAVLMLCLFAFTVFAMFAISGTFISNLDDTFTYYYDNSAFRNGDTRRIVVARPDGGEFTQEDIDKILSVRYVDSVEEWGYVTDIQYAYREGVDYEILYGLAQVGNEVLNPIYVPTSRYSINRTQQNMPFARTIPAMGVGKEFLTAGRLPENLYEVVAAGSEELLGQKITVLVRDNKNWGVNTFIRMEVTVVGVTNHGSHLYFHEDLGRMMVMNARRDLRILYVPMPEDPMIVGKETYQSFGKNIRTNEMYGAVYKLIDGNITGGEETLAMIRQQAYENILDEIADVDEFVRDFTLEVWYACEQQYRWLQRLVSYAARWEMGTQLREALEEVGLYGSDFWAMEYNARQEKITRTLREPEIKERLNSMAGLLFEQVKEAFEGDKKAFMELDFSQLTLEEVKELHFKWFCGQLPESHAVQPGEVMASEVVLGRLINGMALEKIETDEDWTRLWEQADFLTGVLPDLGEMETLADQAADKNLTVLGEADVGHKQVVLLHPDDFKALTYPGKGGQISVFTEDYAYVDRVLDAIHDLGYGAISPYQEGAVLQNEELAAQRTQTLRVCLIALLAVVVLQILLLRAMFSMETESYRLLSHIGLDCVTAQRSVFWQIMLFALCGQVLGVGLILACAMRGMDQVVHILRYLPLSYRLALCVVHLGASAFTAVWTMKALKKQVFPQSGAAPDLDWDETGEEVEA